MHSRRVAKASEAIREAVSTAILFEVKDPRVKNVTVLQAEVSADLRAAKVYVSVMGPPKQQSLCLHGLESARGFLQAKVADRLQTRNTPILRFILDNGVKKSIETARLLREIFPGEGAEGGSAVEVPDDVEVESDDDGLGGESLESGDGGTLERDSAKESGTDSEGSAAENVS